MGTRLHECLVALSLATLLFSCEAPRASTSRAKLEQARASSNARAELSAEAEPEEDTEATTWLQQYIPRGCFHAEYEISRMPSSYSDLTYPPSHLRISGQLEYCSPARFVIQAPDHLAWRDGPTLHILWHWRERSSREALWYRLHDGALTPEEGPARRRPSRAHYPGKPELAGRYALGVEYVGKAPPAMGIFDPQLRALFNLDQADTRATFGDGELIVDTRDFSGCQLHYKKQLQGTAWAVRSECPEEEAKFHPSSVWLAWVKDMRPIERLTIPRATGAPQVHNYACEGAPEACSLWRPLTSAQGLAPAP